MLVSFAVPFLGPFAQIGLVTAILLSLPNILIWFVQIFCAFMMSGVIFLLAFLFAARVFMLQLLATSQSSHPAFAFSIPS